MIIRKDIKNIVLQELKENPYHKFNIAFALMSVIPFLAFFYILINRYSSSDVLIGENGGILFICIMLSLCGLSVGYLIISNILRKMIFYATKLKHSDQLKSTFVASVSHELKNPISVIKMNLFSMSKELIGQINESQKRIIDLCVGVTDRMIRLINDLLDVHKIEAGAVEVRRGQCDIVKILESQINEFDALLSKRGIKIVKEMQSPNLTMWADEDKILQVVNNLLSNAIKYTREGCPITIRLYSIEGFIRLEVTDTGPGIPADKLEKIFDKFERLDATKEGTGLGLAIAKDIVELHKGRIWAENLEGQGSKFVVVLPRDLRMSRR